MADVVFTNHAIERMRERGISGEWAYQTVKHPDKLFSGKEKGTTEFQKQFSQYTITAIAKKNEIGEWVTLSVWMDPPLPGTKDASRKDKYLKYLRDEREFQKKYKKAGFWKRFILTALKQLGL